MTDQEAAEEIVKIEKEEQAAKRDVNAFHGYGAPKVPAARPRPRPRPARPCDNCKSLKKDCDRLLPACTKCQARGIPCVYSRG